MPILQILVAMALASPASAGTLSGASSNIEACNTNTAVDFVMTYEPIVYSGPSYYSTVQISSGSGAELGGVQRRNTAKARLLPGESARLSWAPGPTTSGTTLRLSLSGPGIPNGAVSVPGNTTVSPGGVGDFTYTLSAEGPCGPAGSASITITVHRPRVFLMGSRFSNGPSVLDYMLQPGWTCQDCFQAGINAFDRFSSASQAERRDRTDDSAGWDGRALAGDTSALSRGFKEFADEVRSWPASVSARSAAHVGGNTYVVDERGNVLGSVDTMTLYDNGLPGLSYAGDPSGYGGRNRIWVGSGDYTWQGQTYEVVGLMAASPIVLDLDGDDKPDVDRGEWLPHPTRMNRARSVLFDITATGFPSITEWIGPNDGLLVAPTKRGVSVIGGEKLFGNPIGYLDGYQKLGQLYDKNQDDAIAGEELAALQVWRDRNTNARIDEGELRPAAAYKITRIATKHVNLKGTFTMGGRERSTWDWWPTTMIVYPKPAAKASK
ncbi:MAG: hypothetical protein HY553_19205 [Elusimicrobia bacterium]|nr:hypothetical protein [Elusimicrobiota bacterium]